MKDTVIKGREWLLLRPCHSFPLKELMDSLQYGGRPAVHYVMPPLCRSTAPPYKSPNLTDPEVNLRWTWTRRRKFGHLKCCWNKSGNGGAYIRPITWIIIGNNVQIDELEPNYEIIRFSPVHHPAHYLKSGSENQVFLIVGRCLHGPAPPSFSDDGSDMIFHGWSCSHDRKWLGRAAQKTCV